MAFLPKGYKVPKGPSNYVKFEEGETKIRILTDPVMGNQWWDTVVVDGKDKLQPIRLDATKEIPADIIVRDKDKSDPDFRISHFWAMVVWNYNESRIQILEITQKTIMNKIENLLVSEDWGDPKGYDLTIVKSGEKLETKYDVIPTPPAEVAGEITKAHGETPVKLEALFENVDPFEVK